MTKEKSYDRSKNLNEIVELIRAQANKLIGKYSEQLVDDQNLLKYAVYFQAQTEYMLIKRRKTTAASSIVTPTGTPPPPSLGDDVIDTNVSNNAPYFRKESIADGELVSWLIENDLLFIKDYLISQDCTLKILKQLNSKDIQELLNEANVSVINGQRFKNAIENLNSTNQSNQN